MPKPFAPVRPARCSAQDGSTYPRLLALLQRLLAPDGCPWDREQSFDSLRRHLLEEAFEVAQAIDEGDRRALCEELGDLLMHVAFLSELGRRERSFGPDDVVAAIVSKLVRRHPHVFGPVEAADSSTVLRNWEAIKADERQRRGKSSGMLGSIPRTMPALARAQRITEKVARVGFDWPSSEGARAKVNEELAELDAAAAAAAADSGAQATVEEELGDLLLAVVNLARHLDVDAEAALSKALGKFSERFGRVEQTVEQRHGGWPERERLSPRSLDRYWNEAKCAVPPGADGHGGGQRDGRRRGAAVVSAGGEHDDDAEP